MNFIELIKSRRSWKKYLPEKVDPEDIHKIMEAGTYAPNAMGVQSSFIVAVQDERLLGELKQMNASFLGPDYKGDPYYGAPVVIYVFTPGDWPNGIQDCSLIMENMMLAATSLGYGSCWINRERQMFATERGKEIMAQMGLPEGLVGVGGMALGYKDETYVPKNRPRKEGYCRIV